MTCARSRQGHTCVDGMTHVHARKRHTYVAGMLQVCTRRRHTCVASASGSTPQLKQPAGYTRACDRRQP
eukprot:361815-Chlamydomonas_euryale.AAC.5